MDLEMVGGNPKGTEALILAIVTWVTAPLEGPPRGELMPRSEAGLCF